MFVKVSFNYYSNNENVEAQMTEKNDYEYVRVTAAVMMQGDRVFIAQRKATDRLAGLWEFPGGKIEPAESPEDCLVRELKEELGIDARIGSYLGQSTYRYPHVAIKLLAYRVYWMGGDLTPSDHARCEWVPVKNLPDYSFAPADIPFVEMLIDGRLQDVPQQR